MNLRPAYTTPDELIADLRSPQWSRSVHGCGRAGIIECVGWGQATDNRDGFYWHVGATWYDDALYAPDSRPSQAMIVRVTVGKHDDGLFRPHFEHEANFPADFTCPVELMERANDYCPLQECEEGTIGWRSNCWRSIVYAVVTGIIPRESAARRCREAIEQMGRIGA